MFAYNVKIRNVGNKFCLTWENYCYGTYYRNGFNSVEEAFEYLKKEGWIVKN